MLNKSGEPTALNKEDKKSENTMKRKRETLWMQITVWKG